jgi:hypothetical protein
MVEEDKDESPHMDTDETDEEAQDTGLAFDDDLDSDVVDFTIEGDDRVFMVMVHPLILVILSVLRASGRSSPFCLCFEHSVRMSSRSIGQELKAKGF